MSRAGLLALLAVSTPLQIAAQTGGRTQAGPVGGWSIEAGFTRQGVSDELASPLRHRGTGVFVGGGYASVNENALWGIRVAWAGPRVASRIKSSGGGFEETQQLDIGVTMFWSVKKLLDGRLGLLAGGSLDVRALYRKHHYDALQFGSRTESFGDLFAPFQLSAMWTLRTGDSGRLSHQVSVPVLSLVVRSPYTGLKYSPEVALAGPLTLTGFGSDLIWQTRPGGSWALGVFYRITLLEYPDPLPLAWVTHRLGLRVTL